MKYSVALTAASLASGAVAGVVHGHAGAHQHRAREAEAVANPVAEAEPEPTNYTYSDGQCWGAFGCNSKTGAPASATSAPAATTPAAQPVAQVTSAVAQVKNVVSKATSAAASAASSAASSGSSSSGGSLDVSNLLNKVASASKSTIKSAVLGNLAAADSSMSNQFDIKNESGEDLVWLCWGSAGSWVNSVSPILAVGVSNGDTKTISFADTPSGQAGPACAPVTSFATMVNGQIKNTWLEHTFNSYGTVDVSREPSITGNSISVKTPQGCTSDMDTCVYKCTSESGESQTPGQCMTDYKLVNCSGTGANPSSDGKNGGCQFGSGAGKMTVTVGPVVNSY